MVILKLCYVVLVLCLAIRICPSNFGVVFYATNKAFPTLAVVERFCPVVESSLRTDSLQKITNTNEVHADWFNFGMDLIDWYCRQIVQLAP